MGVLADSQIRELCEGARPMIEPFVGEQRRVMGEFGQKLPSSGLSSAGYDVTLADEFTETDETAWNDYGGIILGPGEFILCRTLETIRMPDDVFGRVYNKSTWARLGLNVATTVLEPGWEGTVTLELANLSSEPIALRPLAGIAQVVFERLERRPDVTYADRDGRYMNQTGVTLAKF